MPHAHTDQRTEHWKLQHRDDVMTFSHFMKGDRVGMEGQPEAGQNPDLRHATVLPIHLPLSEAASSSGPRVWLFIDTNTKAAVAMGWGTQKQKSHFPRGGLI